MKYAQNLAWYGKYDWVNENETRSPEVYPYSFSSHYIWKLDETDGCDVIWADRLFDQDYEKATKAFGEYRSTSNYISPIAANHILKEFYGKKVDVVAYGLSCNVSNGYPIGMFFVRKG